MKTIRVTAAWGVRIGGILLGIACVIGAAWLFPIGGIVQFVQGVTATPVDAWAIAFGVVRFLCTSIALWAGAAFGVVVLSGLVNLADEIEAG